MEIVCPIINQATNNARKEYNINVTDSDNDSDEDNENGNDDGNNDNYNGNNIITITQTVFHVDRAKRMASRLKR